MILSHQSRALPYRKPYGALPAAGEVRLALAVRPEGQEEIRAVILRYAYGLYEFHDSHARMAVRPDVGCPDETTAQPMIFEAFLRMPASACLLLYWFEIESSAGLVFYTANRDNPEGGGQISHARPKYLAGEAHVPHTWQITVYSEDYRVPPWLPGSVFYQVFPDRFRRDSAFAPSRFDEVNAPERIFHLDWNDDVDIHGLPETGYIACDFFGGSLEGIREKLDYIASFGTTVLYLNPIFRARSNHRYDTGDYKAIDPLLGDDHDFKRLCEEAAGRGIRIILDGVFSHTGADSRYFNKYGRYSEIGAWQEISGEGASGYGNWYIFHRKGGQLFYDAWWGFQELPSVNEHDLGYRDFINGPDGIVRRWLRMGASGWRLDVSDELPDSFLRDLRKAVKAEKPDAAIMGEVWEDATSKISYGSYRDFLLGNTHDCVMGYPFQQALLGFLAGHFPAERLRGLLEAIRENYPVPAFYSQYNLIGSHDIPRPITALAGQPDPGSREAQARTHLSHGARQRGEALLRLAVMFQMTFPGCPVIYYGDETAMEGYRDPFNRRTYPWGQENQALIRWFAALGALRRNLPVLRTGHFTMLHAEADCVAFERMLPDGMDVFGEHQSGPRQALFVMNRSGEERAVTAGGRTFELPPYGGVLEIDGKTVLETWRQHRH